MTVPVNLRVFKSCTILAKNGKTSSGPYCVYSKPRNPRATTVEEEHMSRDCASEFARFQNLHNNVHNKIHVREKNHLLQSTICALENSKAIPFLIFTWSWSIIHPDLLFEPKRNLKGGGSGLVKICKARRSSRERFCEQSTRAETLKMAAHTQTLTKSDCLNHTKKDRILNEVSFVYLKTSIFRVIFIAKLSQ